MDLHEFEFYEWFLVGIVMVMMLSNDSREMGGNCSRFEACLWKYQSFFKVKILEFGRRNWCKVLAKLRGDCCYYHLLLKIVWFIGLEVRLKVSLGIVKKKAWSVTQFWMKFGKIWNEFDLKWKYLKCNVNFADTLCNWWETG